MIFYEFIKIHIMIYATVFRIPMTSAEVKETFFGPNTRSIVPNGIQKRPMSGENCQLGWNNLIEDDLRELEDLLAQIPEGSILNMQVRWLFGHPYTEIHDSYQGEEIKLGPFYIGFCTEINLNQIDLNERASEMVERYGRIKHCKLEGLGSIRSDFFVARG